MKENQKVGKISKFIFCVINVFISLRDKGRFPRPCHIWENTFDTSKQQVQLIQKAR